VLDAARCEPVDTVLDEIRVFFQSAKAEDDKKLISKAEKILKGKSAIPGGSTISFSFPFDAKDLDKKEPGWQLFFASLAIPNRLLSAYQVNKNSRFLLAARDMIAGFARYERSAWLPKGLLWNDHAIAARISVLAEFWKSYRNHPSYDPEIARNVLQLIARSRELLAKPSHFTFATNHGIMQNLALLQICLAFPTLPGIVTYKRLVVERLRDQMAFYVNNEGVVLEHSAGYQKAGVEFLSMAFRHLTLLNEPIPEEWKRKYKKAKDFYAQLRRPDGSLPLFGDTSRAADSFGALVTHVDANGKSEKLYYGTSWAPKSTNSLYPVAGYSVRWDGLDKWPDKNELKQTVVAWSHFPGHAHKHADEMSVLLWAGGQKWWTNVGYWPYGTKGRAEAVSWVGSNAPHLVGESAGSERNVALKHYGWSEQLAMIDLERQGPEGYVARRQVVKAMTNLWIIIDHIQGDDDSRSRTIWTTSPEIELKEGDTTSSFLLQTGKRGPTLNKFILFSEGSIISQHRGSFSPFAGWVLNRPASAIVIEQPANGSWAAAIWKVENNSLPDLEFHGSPYMETWKGPENWKIILPVSSGQFSVRREASRLIVTRDSQEPKPFEELLLLKAPEVEKELAALYDAFDNAARKYPRKSYSMRRQLKATYLIIMLLLLQEAFFLIYAKFDGKYYNKLRVLSLCGWIVIGICLFKIYL